jgi:hypothetical protein
MAMDSITDARPRRAALASAVVAGFVLVGCAPTEESRPPIGAGAVTGAAAAGTLAGVAMRNKGPVAATAAVIGAGLVGGYLGDRYIDQPRAAENTAAREAAADAEMQRRLEYERKSARQAEKTRREIEEQQLFEQWKAERGGTNAAVATAADVQSAQRYLTALGYYRGRIDGVYGPQTRSAVMQFEQSQGLPATGALTPSLVERMRAAI